MATHDDTFENRFDNSERVYTKLLQRATYSFFYIVSHGYYKASGHLSHLEASEHLEIWRHLEEKVFKTTLFYCI